MNVHIIVGFEWLVNLIALLYGMWEALRLGAIVLCWIKRCIHTYSFIQIWKFMKDTTMKIIAISCSGIYGRREKFSTVIEVWKRDLPYPSLNTPLVCWHVACYYRAVIFPKICNCVIFGYAKCHSGWSNAYNQILWNLVFCFYVIDEKGN